MSDTVLAVEVDGDISVGDATYGVFYPDYQSVYFGYDWGEAREAVTEYNADHLLNDGSQFPEAYIVEVMIR